QFAEWLLRSPGHVEEYLAAASTWEALGHLPFDAGAIEALIAAAKDSPDDFGKVLSLDSKRSALRASNVLTGRDDALAEAPDAWEGSISQRAANPSDSGRRRFIAAAASVAILAIAAGSTALLPSPPWRRAPEAQSFQTAIGEQRRVTLADRSVLLLNTNSAVDVRWLTAERRVDLLRGEAQFEVSHDAARPFIVTTRQASVRVLGTTFDVRTDSTVTQVAVVKGLVEVTPARPSGRDTRQSNNTESVARVQLRAEDRAVVSADTLELNSGPPVAVLTAWTQQRLVFRDQSLTDVVSEFNRYQAAPLVVTDAQLGKARISGVFDSRDPASLLEYLQIYEQANIRHSPDGTVYISTTPQSD
ncbi:MAG TPA: FecR domain-containing protein, partial [Steroidobacteraceae bacterium]